jgi:hypothetical protein
MLVSCARTIEEFTPFVGFGWLHLLTVANKLNAGDLQVPFHSLIASESDVNTKSGNSDCLINCVCLVIAFT